MGVHLRCMFPDLPLVIRDHLSEHRERITKSGPRTSRTAIAGQVIEVSEER